MNSVRGRYLTEFWNIKLYPCRCYDVTECETVTYMKRSNDPQNLWNVYWRYTRTEVHLSGLLLRQVEYISSKGIRDMGRGISRMSYVWSLSGPESTVRCHCLGGLVRTFHCCMIMLLFYLSCLYFVYFCPYNFKRIITG